jgi:tetratricopeptide (TPR) repeat protein
VGARAKAAFVGRAAELAKLAHGLEAAQAGSGATVLVAGEAGIGKTRLASEIAERARDAGVEVLLGRSIDLVGTELPYQPFAEALRPLGERRPADGQAAGSQLRVFEETLALLTDHAAVTPVLLVLEDLHWADTSTLDLVVFLAHNLADCPVLLLATYRADEFSSAERMRRLADGVQRSGSGLVLELGPLAHEELTALLTAYADDSVPATLTDVIVARSEGNPFFAEELFAAAGDQRGELPGRLRDLLLQRVARLGPDAQSVLRLAAAAGRGVGYPLLRALTALPEHDLRESLRQAVEHEVLVPDQATGIFSFRHALLAEAIYTRILPGEREELHARLADELSRTGAASPRAVELARRAIDLAGDKDPLRAALLHVHLGVYTYATGSNDAGLAALEHAVELVPVQPPSPERAQALAALGTGLHMAWRHEESLAICQQALVLARATGARAAELRALTVLGSNLAYLARSDEGLARLSQAVQLAAQSGDPAALQRAYVSLTDVLTMLGRPRESAALAETGLKAIRSYGVETTVLVANQVEALLAIGDWDEADRASAAALRAMTGSYPYMLLIIRADVEIGRGDFDAARAHLETAAVTLREDRGLGLYDAYLAELALWERRWADADAAVDNALAQARSTEAAQIRVQLCAKGLRALAELAVLARARRDANAQRDRAGPRPAAARHRSPRCGRGRRDHA